MAKKTNKGLIVFVLLAFYVVSQGQQIFTGAVTCTSNEPSTIQGYLDYFEGREFSCEEEGGNSGGYTCANRIGATFAEGYFIVDFNIAKQLQDVPGETCDEFIDEYIQGGKLDITIEGIKITNVDDEPLPIYGWCSRDGTFIIAYTDTEDDPVIHYTTFFTRFNEYYDDMYTCADDTPTTPAKKEWYSNPIIWIIIIFGMMLIGGKKR